MTDFRINVVVDPKSAKAGIDKVEDGLQHVEKTADKMGETIKHALEFVGIGLGIHELLDLAEAFEAVERRLGAVIEDEAQLEAVTRAVFEISNQTRTAVDKTASSYVRLSAVGKDLGKSQNDILEFTRLLNEALILSGQSTEQAEFGLQQFTRGLTDGILQGRDLLIILKEMPVVAEILAKKLGITTSELRQFGQQGALSASVVFDAFEQARTELDERFGKSVPTVSQAIVVLKNHAIELLGEFNKANGVTALLSKGIIFLADHIEDAARVLLFFTTILGVQFVSAGVKKAIAGLEELGVALLANPLTALPAIIAAAVAALIAFGDKIQFTADSEANLQDVTTSLFSATGDELHQLAEDAGGVFDAIDIGFGDMSGTSKNTLRDVLLGIAAFVDAALGLFTGLFNATVETIVHIGPAVADVTIQLVNGMIGLVENGVDDITALFQTAVDLASNVGGAIVQVFAGLGAAAKQALSGNFDDALKLADDAQKKFRDSIANSFTSLPEDLAQNLTKAASTDLIPKLENSFEDGAKDLGTAVINGFKAGLEVDVAENIVNKAFTNAQKKADEHVLQLAKDAAKAKAGAAGLATPSVGGIAPGSGAFTKVLVDLQKESDLLLLNAHARELGAKALAIEEQLRTQGITLTGAQSKQLQVQLEFNQMLGIQAKVLDEVKGPQQNYIDRISALNALLITGRITQEEYDHALETSGLGEVNKQLADQEHLLSLNNSEREVATQLLQVEQQLRAQGIQLGEEEKAQLEIQLEHLQLLSNEAAILEQINGPQQAFAQTQAALNDLLGKGTITLEQYNKAMRDAKIASEEAGTSIDEGFTRGFDKVDKQLNDLASLSEKTVVDGFGAAEDAIVDFAKTGKLNVSGLVDSVLADLTKLLARQALLGLVNFLGGGNGTAGIIAQLFGGGKAGGGDVDPSKAFLVGEKGPELFVPNSSGVVVPNDATLSALQAGNGGKSTTVVQAPAPQVNVSVVNVTDPKEAVSAIDSNEGGKVILNQLGKNREAAKRLLA